MSTLTPSASSPQGMQLVGVNLASAEFAPQNDPGSYGKDYTYSTHQEIDYYAAKGMTVFRLPFLMDRMQDAANGSLNQAQLGYMDGVVSYATSKGIKVILDPHDYGYEHGTLIADPSSVAAFANFWGKLAAHYAANANVIFGLENEPHVQTADQWLPAVNAAIAAIRNAGATQEVLVPGVAWESAAQFTSNGSSTTLALGVKDPAQNYAFEVHQYLDSDGSGTSTSIANGDANIGAERLQAVTQWAKQTGSKLFLGETGVGTDANSTAALANMLASMQQNAGVWQGVTYWAGGPWWGNTSYSIEPTGLGTSNVADRPQMAVLSKYVPASLPSTVTVGAGAHALALAVSEDAWQGDAQFTVSVDGKQVGGTQTATASHGAGLVQTFAVMGDFAAGGHTAAVNFLNDAYGGSPAADRNLYVSGAQADGASVPGANLALLSAGAQSFSFSIAGAAPGTSATDTLDLHVSEDAWQGDAQFTVAVDGAVVGGVRTATASHASGASQDVSMAGSWGAGPHSVAVAFINDAWGGTAATDRNLYVDQVSYDGLAAAGAPVALTSNGTASFAVSGPAKTTVTLHLAEDAWQGDAQFSASVDGVALASAGTVTASNAQNQSQSFNLQALLSAGKHDLAVSFLNDAWGGTSATDRNLYVKGVDVNGTPVSGASAALLSTGAAHFQITVPST